MDMVAGEVQVREGYRFSDVGLSDEVLLAVRELGYQEMTEVQAKAIPEVLTGRDVMAAAQTGTGKTCAFMLPALSRLQRVETGAGPTMLVVTPTRELAAQIAEVADAVGAKTGHVTATVVGGVGYEGQREALRAGVNVLVATPGRLIDLIEEGTADLSGVSVLVLDEADRMLDMGFAPQVRRIVERVPTDRQTLLFSATLTGDVLRAMGDVVRDPVRVEVTPAGTVAQTVDHYVLPVSSEAKKRALLWLLSHESTKRVIVFCRGKHRADHLSRVLVKKGVSAAPIHGNRTQNQRARALARFQSGEVDVLVATDVLARGIDVAGVTLVVNLDVPTDPESYVHRIGRTGRAGETGLAVTMCDADEYLDLRAIERLMGRLIETYPNDTSDLDTGEHPAVLDPARSPADRLPSPKARRRARAAGAAKQAETAEGTAAAPERARRQETRKDEGTPAPSRRRRRRSPAGSAAAPGTTGTPAQTRESTAPSERRGGARRRRRPSRQGSQSER